MTSSGACYREEDLAQMGVHINTTGWIQVQRRHPAPSAGNTWMGGQAPGPSTGQQSLSVEDIVALVHQHGSEDPWDCIAAVQAPEATAVNWYDTRQRQYQYHNYETDRRLPSDLGAGNIGSTRADHGSQESNGRLKSSERVEGESRTGKPKNHHKSHPSCKHVP